MKAIKEVFSNGDLNIESNEVLSEDNSENEREKNFPFITEENEYKIPNL